MNRKHFIVLIFFIAGIYACNKETVQETFTGFQKPVNFPTPVYNFSGNEVTQGGFELGRKLFYDPLLSVNNSISCGNCHIQTSAFTQHGHSVSHGIFDRLGTRNSPPVMNLAWNSSFMWDGGIFDLDLQPLAPIANHVEMGEDITNVLNKLKSTTVYPPLFAKAYGSTDITTTRFLKALSQFMVMCVSNHSKYDSVMTHAGVSFSPTEEAGYQLFKQKCNSCHPEPLFTDFSFRNNGLVPSGVNDLGRYLVTLNDADKYKFKVPSLRNLQYTAPFMHDGRFFTLDAVLEHYNSQVQLMPTLDPLLHPASQAGIPLSSDERNKLLAFLGTLNDRVFITDKRFAEQ